MAGFECTDKLNAFGHRVDFLTLTKHLEFLDEDYRSLEQLNIRTVREGIRWSKVETKPYEYDWAPVKKIIERGLAHGVQQVWDLCHFGYPDDLTPLHPMFARRFAALCRAFVKFYRTVDNKNTLIVTPINEVGFISWLGGDVRGTVPYCVGQGWEVKYRLMKAYIEGVEALLETEPGIRILTTEPLVSIIPPPDATPAEKETARAQHEHQFQVLDILSGRMCPELRGRPEYLDLVGVNFYYDNQWMRPPNELLVWTRRHADVRWVPLHLLLKQVYDRYGCRLVLSETSHPKEDRPLWVEMIEQECRASFEMGLPLLGVCWYPIIDRPDWDHPHIWHQSGIWDRRHGAESEYERLLHEPTAVALRKCQNALAGYITPGNPPPA